MLKCLIPWQYILLNKITFALHDVSGTIKVGGGVSRACHTVVLSKLSLVCAHGTANAAVCAGVVVMSRRALDCRRKARRQGTISTNYDANTSPELNFRIKIKRTLQGILELLERTNKETDAV